MTRRIALFIFVTVASMLIIGGLVAYLTTRAVLLAELDESLVDRALSVPTIGSEDEAPGSQHAPHADKDDRYIVRTDAGRTIASIRAGEAGVSRPRPLLATFFHEPDGTRGRSVTIRTVAHTTSPDRAATTLTPVTVTYSGSCAQFDALMLRLGMTLIACVGLGAAIAAVVAVYAATVTLRPLRETAAVIHQIDEQQLGRRLEVSRLPSELRPVALRLNEMLARLQAASEARRRFLANTSHELRTPLAALAAALQVTLRRPRSAEEYRDAMEACLSEARHLRHLVDLLTEQARGENTAIAASTETFDLLELMRECATLGNSLGEDRQIQVAMQRPAAGLEVIRIRGASYRLRSAVMNAVSNAVEYGRTGGHVELSCGVDPGGGVVLRVCDDGAGIDARHIPHLFEPFYRVDAARGADDGHFGLGLFIMQSHLQAMGGTCEIESEPGQGTTLKMLLPSRLIAELGKAPAEDARYRNEPDTSTV